MTNQERIAVAAVMIGGAMAGAGTALLFGWPVMLIAIGMLLIFWGLVSG